MPPTPRTPHATVTHALNLPYPAELAWIAEKAEGPDWFLNTAAVPVAGDEDDGVSRLLSDDGLSQYPGPAAVLLSWPGSPGRR